VSVEIFETPPDPARILGGAMRLFESMETMGGTP
jgi:hypothetical protein